MFKIIAALAFVASLLARLADAMRRAADWVYDKTLGLSETLYDVRQRVIGATLTAHSQRLVENNAKFAAVDKDQRLAAETASLDLDHDIKVAYEAYSKALNVVGTVCDNQRIKLNAKARALREKRAQLRSML